MNCKTCNKLLGELNPTCAECIEGMRDQIDSLKKEKKDLFEDQKERIQEGNILRTENAALKAEIEEWRHSQDMSFKAVEEADKEVKRHKKALELAGEFLANINENCPADYVTHDGSLCAAKYPCSGKQKECWKEYFLARAEAELKGEKGNG